MTCANGATLCLQLPSCHEDRVSLAHLPLPDEVDDLLNRLGAEVENLAHGATYLACLRRHYRGGAGWTEAFAGLLAELFAPYGLIVVNPRCAELAGIAAGVHRTAVERAAAIAAALQARGRQLEDAGFPPTVHVRDGAPLSFFHPDGAAGARYRLQPSSGGWRQVGGDGAHSTAELFAALQREPLSFSTSVLLRPILQDTLLPTAAYVGGGGEVAYFAQLEPLYEEYGLAMPLVVPRAGFRLVEAKTQRLLERIGADATCAARPEHDLVAAAAPRVTAVADRWREQLLADFGGSLARLRGELEKAGPGMAKAIAKTRASVEHAVDRLIGKYETALLHEQQDLVEAVREIKRLLYPEGMPQERFYGWPYFAARYGENELVARLVDAVVPFDPAVRDLRLEDAA